MVDVRILAASNRDLRQRIQEGLFREDLYYRLNVVTLEIPPLRERGSDIPELATFFLGRYAQENGKRVEGFSDEALQALLGYPFPGNVRELENLVERAVVLCDGPRIELRHLPATLRKEPDGAADAMPRVPGSTIYELERYAILRTLEACKGSTSKAATILGISPRKIQYKLHEYSAAKQGSDKVAVMPEPRSTSGEGERGASADAPLLPDEEAPGDPGAASREIP
jgi:DNA-binding NtrC family response regulator